MTEDRIRRRIEQLEHERDQFVQQANQQIAGYNAAIGELRALLEPEVADGDTGRPGPADN